MGLDMYLTGEVFFFTTRRERGQRQGEFYDLGYWRKHPDLHGYIVQAFANGEDHCQRIDLSADDLRKIITAVNTRSLPKTTGFFFGESDGTEWIDDIDKLTDALRWLEKSTDDECRSVYYRASW
jgi:hypothetical protein